MPFPVANDVKSVFPVLVPALQALGPTSPATVCVALLFALPEIAINLAFVSKIVTFGVDVYPEPAAVIVTVPTEQVLNFQLNWS